MPARTTTEEPPSGGCPLDQRERIVARYDALVRYAVNRAAASLPRHVEVDDLLSAGFLGLLAAVDAFDPARGTPFHAYALLRIRGAMMDYIRRLNPLSRPTRHRIKAIERTLAKLEQELGRRPADEETAERLGMTVTDYRELALTAAASRRLSLDEEGEDEAGPLAERVTDPRTPDPLHALTEAEERRALQAAVASLRADEQLVLQLHYVEERGFHEIGRLTHMSESWAARAHAAALLQLHRQLGRSRDGR